MKNFLRKIDRRFQLTRPKLRPGSVLILVVALLVLMALIGTAFLTTQRADRYNAVEHTNNTEIDLLVEGVKNMAKATIVGSLNDPSLPFTYRPANSTIAKNWDAYDLYHQYTTDAAIGTTPNDAWLSPRCPTDLFVGTGVFAVVWPCIGEPLTGNTFESPIVLPSSGVGSASQLSVPLTYTDRVTGSTGSVKGYAPPPAASPSTPAQGNLLTPTFATIMYPDGSSASYPAFTLGISAGTYTFLAGDADGDGIADCGLWKLPTGPIDGLTYYAGCRIIDNCAAVNVNTAISRRFDLNGSGAPTRSVSGATPTYNGCYNLGCFPSNVGMAELLQSYNGGFPTDAQTSTEGLSGELGAWLYSLLGYQDAAWIAPTATNSVNAGVYLQGQTAPTVPPTPPFSGVITTDGNPSSTSGVAPNNSPVFSISTLRADFAYSTLGDLLTSQIGRRPSNPGYVGSTNPLTSTAVTLACQPATDNDAAALAYHFVFNNPNADRTPVELALHSSLYDNSPNGPGEYPNPATITGPLTRPYDSSRSVLPGVGATSYTGSAANASTIVNGWYSDNFDWFDDLDLTGSMNNYPKPNAVAEGCATLSVATSANAGQFCRSRRSIFTANSAVSNLTPRPVLTAYPTAANGSITIVAGMSPVTPTMCKTSINTAPFADLWRAFWLSMAADNGLSPLGTNSGSISGAGYAAPTPNNSAGTATPNYDHDLVASQSIFTGSQFTNPLPANNSGQATSTQNTASFATPNTYPQHPQAMFRSTLRNPTSVYYGQSTGGFAWSYIEADQMVVLRSAIAAANATAMRYPPPASSGNANSPVFAYDVPLKATIHGTANTQVYARVYGATYQPYITEVYANTNVLPSQELATHNLRNTAPYVAIELFNPYKVPINLAGWQLALVDRSAASDNNRGLSATSVIYTFPATDPASGQLNILEPYTGVANSKTSAIYQGSYALLENLGGTGVTYRPVSSGLPATGSVAHPGSATVGGPLIDITVPTLGQAIPLDTGHTPTAPQELVLLRPLTGTPTNEAVIDQVPVDSYDFTGLTYGGLDPNTANPVLHAADTWHYVRGNASNAATVSPASSNSLWRFIYPGRYDATDPTPYNATASATVTVTQPTSPARAVLNNPGFVAYSRRQQGTQAARYHPDDPLGPPGTEDPFAQVAASPAPTLGGTSGTNDNFLSSYPVTFPFQYLNNDEPGAWPLTTTIGGNAFPFSQFARNSDMLQVPFVGSYLIFSAAPSTASGFQATGMNALALSAADVTDIIEVNPMPMDCSFAEDTDLTDDPPLTDNNVSPGQDPYIWSESVGHFAPVNTTNYTGSATTPGTYRHLSAPALTQAIADSDPTLSNTSATDPYAAYKVQYVGDLATQEYWRYHWASRLFDYLTVQNPNDDFFPNVQQQIYSQVPPTPTTFTPAGTVYGPTPLPIQNTLSITTPGNSNTTPPSYTEDTVPVYGLININTAPWRVLSALRICPYDDAETDAAGNKLAMQFAISPLTGSVATGNTDGVPDNVRLAQAIAQWRDQGPSAPNISANQVNVGGVGYPYGVYKGPFTSLADILNVPVVQNYLYEYNSGASPPVAGSISDNQKTAPSPNAVQGHLAPFDFYGATPSVNTATPAQLLTNGVRNDVEERFDLLSRLSNQATVKSDVYTVYIVVQGWQNAGSTSSSNPPKMVTQRRAAFIVDRTGVTPTNSTVKTINIPTD